MSITWDALLTAATARELRRRLPAHPREGARLRAFHLDHHARSLLLWFREGTLAFRLHPGAGALLLLDPAEPVEGARPLAATLRAVEAPPDDRILLLHLRKVRGGREPWLVAMELLTNQWNAVLAEGGDRRIRHILRERQGDRPIEVGGVYRPPPPTHREGIDGDLSLDRWRELLAGADPGDRRRILLTGVAWTSSVNADGVLGDASRDERVGDGDAGWPGDGAAPADPRSDAAAPADPGVDSPVDAAWRRWRRLLDALERLEPVILVRDRSLQPYPCPLPGYDARPVDDLFTAFRGAAGEGAAGVTLPIPSAWVRALETRAGRARGKVRGLERELEGAPDPAELRLLGDLILARFHQVPRGTERVTLQDFQGEEVEVELEPALSPQENAAAWYDRAARAERALEKLPAMLEDAREEARRLDALVERVRSGEADAEEVEAELPERSDDGTPAPDDASPALPYRTYRSSGGLEIRVGRGSKQNDDLTFHHSRPDDVWLHARHAAGAHVILRWDGDDNPPARDLAEAATLAALHSKARTAGSAPVDWTRRKHVRKPRKAPPGAVVPDRVQTVFVQPDRAVEARLRTE